MKKVLVAIILILSALIPTACSCGKDVCAISATQTEFSIALNETLNLNDCVEFTGADGFSTSFEGDLISVTNGVVTPLASGEVEIRCELNGYDDIYTTIKVVIRDVYLAKSASVNKQNIIINMGVASSAINKVEIEDNVTEEPQVIYDKSIIGYDYITGSITARSVGTTNVKIIYEKCSVEFKVKVENSIYLEYLSAEDETLYVNDRGKFNVTMTPSDANQYKFYSYSTILGVDSSGNYVAKGSGKAVVYIEYLAKNGNKVETKTESFNVTIYALPDSIDFDFLDKFGNEFDIFFKGEEGRIVLKLEDYEMYGEYQFGGDIKITSEDVSIDQHGNNYVTFVATKTGKINVEVACNILIDEVPRKISKTKTLNVLDTSDVDLIVKSDIYNVPKLEGVYTVSSGMPISIFFKLDNVNIEDIDLYLVTKDAKTELTVPFVLSEAGRYTLKAEHKGLLIFEIVVVVV